MRVRKSLLIFLCLSACQTTPFENAQQLAQQHEYAEALELLKAEGFDTTSIECLSFRAVAFFAENRTEEGFQDIERLNQLNHDGRFHAAKALVKAATVAGREKFRAIDVIALLDSAVAFDPSMTGDVVNLAWLRGIEFLNSSGDAGRLYLNCGIKYDSNLLSRLRAHDITLARRYDELSEMVKSLPAYAEYGRKFFTNFGKFPTNLLDIQNAFPEAGLRNREGWEITIDGRDGKIVALATSLLGNRLGIKRGTVLVGG